MLNQCERPRDPDHLSRASRLPIIKRLQQRLNASLFLLLVEVANRGIGLGFVQHYAAAGWKVIATCRKPDAAE